MPKSHLMFSRVIPTDFGWMFFIKPLSKSMLTNPTVALNGLWRNIYVFVKSRLKLPLRLLALISKPETRFIKIYRSNIQQSVCPRKTWGSVLTSISTKQDSEEYIKYWSLKQCCSNHIMKFQKSTLFSYYSAHS